VFVVRFPPVASTFDRGDFPKATESNNAYADFFSSPLGNSWMAEGPRRSLDKK